MKPDSNAWSAHYDHAASLLRPGFAERTLRAARTVAPTFVSQCILSAVTASICLLVVFLVHSRITANETARNIEAWDRLAAESELLGQVP